MARFKIRRKMSDRMVAGVCSAIAATMNIDPLWIRVAVVAAGIFVFPWVFLAYLIAAIIIPKDDSENYVMGEAEYRKVYRIKEGKMVGGVCTGLEKYFDVDVVAIRLLFIVSLFMGFGFILYPILWIITPLYKPQLVTN
jgi:phage shock protein PspC (stress-responsive transcriptional regulator)